eukprot:15134517-Alexandrium_andersonii.AAC.1
MLAILKAVIHEAADPMGLIKQPQVVGVSSVTHVGAGEPFEFARWQSLLLGGPPMQYDRAHAVLQFLLACTWRKASERPVSAIELTVAFELQTGVRLVVGEDCGQGKATVKQL